MTHRGTAALLGTVLSLLMSCRRSPPVAPSATLTPGTYTMTASRCPLGTEAGPEVAMKFPCGSDRWTIAVTRDEVSGTTEGSCPPFVWSGTFGGRLSSGRALQITQLHYEQGTTHSDHETLRLSGSLTVDHVGIAGRLDGEYSTFETFGSARGPTRSCQAFAVPVRFTPLR